MEQPRYDLDRTGCHALRMVQHSHWYAACVTLGYYSIFFFSSRRRHTRLQGDWSSDVCSSDLFVEQSKVVLAEESEPASAGLPVTAPIPARPGWFAWLRPAFAAPLMVLLLAVRSGERRVGEEGRSRWSPYH